MILKPARSSARDAAASCVTTSAQSRPSSIILMTPPIWPCARLSRLSTLAIVSLYTSMPTPSGARTRLVDPGVELEYPDFTIPDGVSVERAGPMTGSR